MPDARTIARQAAEREAARRATARLARMADAGGALNWTDTTPHTERPPVPDTVAPELPRDGEATTTEIAKLRRRVELAERARDRHLPCPDHRDKVREGECQVCRAERAEALSARLSPPREGAGTTLDPHALEEAMIENMNKTPLTAPPLPGIPPAEYIAKLISRLLVDGNRSIVDEPPEDRIAAKQRAKQVARILATFCSPVGNYGHPYATHLAPSEAGGREEETSYGHDLDIVRRSLRRQNRTPEQVAFAEAALDRLAARLASRSSGDGERWKRIAHYFRDARNGWRRTARLASRSAQDRTDAQRYRFLRDNPLGLRAVDGNAKYPPPNAEQMDRHVDHAREDAAIIAEAAAEIRAARAAEGSEHA